MESPTTANPPAVLTFAGFKRPPQLPERYQAATLHRLMAAVRSIQKRLPLDDSLEELYRACENLCLHDYAEPLYTNLREELAAHIAFCFIELDRAPPADGDLLTAVEELWAEYNRQVRLLSSIFLYLDRTYVHQTPQLPSLRDLALELFRAQWLQHDALRNRTLAQLMAAFTTYRRGDGEVNRASLRALVGMYIDLLVYPTGFEYTFLERTQAFYQEESTAQLADLGATEGETRANRVAAYLAHAERRLDGEKELAAEFLHLDTKAPLLAVVSQCLLTDHVDTLVNQGLDALLVRGAVHHGDLARLYRLLSRVDRLDTLRTAYGRYVATTGRSIVLDTAHDDSMVERLITLKRAQDQILAYCFDGNEHFAETLRASFEQAINARPTRPAQLIARFLDATLRSGNLERTDVQLEDTLNQALALFRYLHGKDVFEAFYKRDLARRLLLKKSASTDAEKSMLVKLKAECGAEFTHKLEGMFRDIGVSEELEREFETAQEARLSSKARGKRPATRVGPGMAVGGDAVAPGFHFRASVLTQAFWPTYAPVSGVILPAEITAYQDRFRAFYLDAHKQRLLMWQDSLATVVLRAQFDAGRKELELSCYQALVLLLFNDVTPDTTLSYADIQRRTGVADDDELIRTLQSLACGKYRVLTKTPLGREVIPATDAFTVNREFSAPLFRLRISTIQQGVKESDKETAATTEKVFQDRLHQVDAAIVRLMKAQQTLPHTQLLNLIFQTLKFPITAAELKKRIDAMIDRDYMERDPEDPTLYRYLA
ncbi:hypothetical protein IWQ60_011718 [Tieghemiomyces parasiticus]|uniref:Cullin family profile domain-containing protein n=1 Tax=Tieghemiomyces parasiticus TaxID=78921 RepID=A0A9W8DM02_9FUNG|nr:hypothetical protein IWQ60_011718 [Tieghemiomyces parasiticus]